MESTFYSKFSGIGLLGLLILPLTVPQVQAEEAAKANAPAAKNCSTTREYVTALEFLRHKKDFAIPEADARKLATHVAEGCNGAAERFVRVSSVLAHAGLSANDAIDSALKLSRASDAEATTFITVFERAFLTEYLDLDLRASMHLAQSLTTGFQGNIARVRDDFSRFVDFCVKGKSLDLPRPQCAQFAARLTRLGSLWHGGSASPFLETFDFLRSEKGPGLITGQALSIAEEVISAGPGAPENFIQAYKYASSSKGLALNNQEALAFARSMSKRRVPEPAQKTTGT